MEFNQNTSMKSKTNCPNWTKNFEYEIKYMCAGQIDLFFHSNSVLSRSTQQVQPSFNSVSDIDPAYNFDEFGDDTEINSADDLLNGN